MDMNEKIRQIELGFRNIGYVVVPAEFIKKLLIRDVRMEFCQSSDGTYKREAVADYVYIEIKSENIKIEFKEVEWRLVEETAEFLDLLNEYDVTHIVVRYMDNSKEEFMVAWSDLENDFLSSSYVRLDESSSMICVVIDFDKFQFDKHIV